MQNYLFLLISPLLTISNISFSSCSDNILNQLTAKRLTLKQLEHEHLASTKDLDTQINSFSSVQKSPTKYLLNHTQHGNELYVNNGVLTLQLVPVKNISGSHMTFIYRAIHDGENLIIKNISRSISDYDILITIQNAKFMEVLGLGPKTDIVKLRTGQKLLIMEEVPGINIKEVLYQKARTPRTKARIDKVLGFKTNNIDQAVKLFAKRFFTNPQYEHRLLEIQRILLKNNFNDASDMQFMFQFSKPQDSMGIIDADFFARTTDVNSIAIQYRTAEVVKDILKKLKSIAEKPL